MLQRDGSIIRVCDQGGSEVTMQQMSAVMPQPSSNTQRKIAGKRPSPNNVVVAARKTATDEQR
jgi:hypothetical protein